jgi:hypothetical protein
MKNNKEIIEDDVQRMNGISGKIMKTGITKQQFID